VSSGGVWAAELRRLSMLAWPVVLGHLGTMGMGVVDTMMVGRLGADALASVSLGHTWSWLVLVTVTGGAHGLDPHFAQAFGARKPHAAGATLIQGLALLSLLSLPVLALHFLAGPALSLMGQPAQLIPTADAYVRVLAPSIPMVLGFQVLRQYLQGDGWMRPAAWVVFLANGVNALLNWVLIYGGLGGPALGEVGSAWATLIARTFMLAGLLVLGWPLVKKGMAGWAGAVSPARLIALARDVVPVGLQVGLESWAFGGSTMLVGLLGAIPLAAHTVTLNMAALSFMVPLGISAAASTRVGNLMGEGRSWTVAAWTAVGLGASVMLASASAYTLLPEPLLRLFTDDAAVLLVGAGLLPLLAAFQIFDGIQVVSFGVLRGAGDVRLPALANVLGYWVLGLPIGCWLAFPGGWGARGIWLGLTIGLAVVAVLLLFRLRYTAARGGYRVI